LNKSSIWTHAGMRMMFLRRLHSWIGAFIAPSILFFSFTGALQLFSLHEAHGDYQPPVLIEKLGKLHKDQEFTAKPRGPGAAAAPDHDEDHDADAHDAGAKPADADHDHDAKASAADHDHAAAAPDKDHPKAKPEPKLATTSLKWLFLGVAIGLFVSTLVGIWMALTQSRDKKAIIVLLVLGTIAPIVLAAM
jgi:hypothetical protein